jgi:molybdopterin-containing oxidoreductase family membrane subunit
MFRRVRSTPPRRRAWIRPLRTASVSRVDVHVLSVMEQTGLGYWLLLATTGALALLGVGLWTWQVYRGLGVAGYQHPVFWGAYVASFVFWVGIAHAGTLISAILYLFRAKWRNAINRAAETMTVISVLNAMLFLGVHLGRFWKAYFILPYPNQRALWVNFKSPLVWDTFAINTYATIGTGPKAGGAHCTPGSRSAGREAHASGRPTAVRCCTCPASPRRWCCRCTA